MSDSAKGPLSGYLFQFERGLYLLSCLEQVDEYISIEQVDDVSIHRQDGTVLFTDQAKHSISESGSQFTDTSYALWRTLEIWIEKYKKGIFSKQTKFIFSSNKEIKKDSLIDKIVKSNFETVKKEIERIESEQSEKLKKLKKGNSVRKILKIIKFVLNDVEVFKKIQSSCEIQISSDLKSKIFTKLHLESDQYTEIQKEKFFQELFGWLTTSSVYKWRNKKEARFRKKELDNKLYYIHNTPSIVNAIFRAKSLISVDEKEIELKKSELFVRQIEEISRRKDAKKKIIKKAIEDFIRYEIEHAFLINNVGDFTKEDFEVFIENCFNEWETHSNNVVKYDFDSYSEKEKNEMAIDIYDYIMSSLKIKFKKDHSFNIENEYFKNGSFLKLSNIPRLGWHPEWEKKYNK